MRDTDAPLHNLKNLAFLQYADEAVAGFAFIFLSFHEKRFACLSVDSIVQQVLVISSYFACKTEATDQSDLNWSHLTLEINY